MSEVSEEALLEFFGSSGGGSGRLRNADLLRTFKPFIGHPDPQLRGKFTDQPIIKQQKQTITKPNHNRALCLLLQQPSCRSETVFSRLRRFVDVCFCFVLFCPVVVRFWFCLKHLVSIKAALPEGLAHFRPRARGSRLIGSARRDVT